MSAHKKAKGLMKQLVFLTPRARERWSILITMMELTIEKLEKEYDPPIILHVWEIDDKGHTVGTIRNTIDILRKTSPQVIRSHEKKRPYDIRFIIKGIEYIEHELKTWEEIEALAEIDTLTVISLDVLRKITDKLKRRLESTIPD